MVASIATTAHAIIVAVRSRNRKIAAFGRGACAEGEGPALVARARGGYDAGGLVVAGEAMPGAPESSLYPMP